MARTLVIKNADFSSNKVTTVSFGGDVPCTGISFASDTISITGYDTETVEYTLTPSNTTDIVTWASSNTDIITVADGVITTVGVGSCTLTATCGTYTATATVTVTMYALPDWIRYYLNANSSNHVLYYSGSEASTNVTAIGSGEQAGDYLIYNANNTSASPPVIKLPKNTGRIKITVTDGTYYDDYNGGLTTKVRWCKDESAGWSSFANAAYYDSMEDAYSIRTTTTKTFDVPSGIDAFVFETKFKASKASIEEVKAAITASGLTIEFLPAA